LVGSSAFLARGLSNGDFRGRAGFGAVHELVLVEAALTAGAIVAGALGQYVLRTVNRRTYAAVRVRSR
jgi:hypothetical protein